MIRIKKHNGIIRAIVPLSPSKSITNRVLVIRALSDSKFEIINTATADDSALLNNILENITPEINAGDSGTAFRFLTAFLSIQEGEFILTGSERMKQRPVGPLVAVLRSLGADISYSGNENYPPLRIRGKKLAGGKVSIDASESSQFVSALLMIAPCLQSGLEIELTGNVNSRPYIQMTLSLMNYFGVDYVFSDNFIRISPQKYISKTIKVENDWSSASFWYLMAAQSENAEILLKDLKINSVQGDSVISEIMEKLGVLSESDGENVIIRKNNKSIVPALFQYDFSSCPDLVIPVAALCSVSHIKAELKGVKNLRIKESDRLSALKSELEKTGATIIVGDDYLKINPAIEIKNEISFHSHNDHRMVMAAAALAMSINDVFIDNHLPVSKSYPEFWQQFKDAGFDFSF